eukprot:COSAG04_NODE_319_length_16893_cov_23.060141_11_plen_274_part_00
MKAEMSERRGGLLGAAQKLKGKAQSWHANREAAAERRKAVAAQRAAEQAEAQAWQVQEEANRKLRQMEEVAEGERLERQRWEEEYAVAEERRRQEQEERRYEQEQEQEQRWQEQEREREREWRRQEQEQEQKQQRWHEQERERQQREQDTRMLPAGWSSAVSRTTGDVYYINIATGHTTYEYPEASALPGAGGGDDWDGRQDERRRHQADHDEGWGIRMISGVSAPRFRPFFAHFPPSLARSLRLGARKPDSAKNTAKERRKKGQKRGRNSRI